MKQNSNHSQFESLAANLCQSLPRVKDANSLLQFTVRILSADVAVLLSNSSQNNENLYKIEAVYPTKRHQWAVNNIKELRWWSELPNAGYKYSGFPLESELVVDNEKFPGSLVAFSCKSNIKRPPKHEFVLLQKSNTDFCYSTYHSAIAETLLRHYEQLEELKSTKKSRQTFANLLSLDILLECDWDEFVRRVGKENKGMIKEVNFMGPAAVLASAYFILNRRKFSNTTEDKKPLIWLKKRRPPHKWQDTITLIEFLKETRPLDQKRCEIIMGPNFDSENGNKAALFVLEHSWRLVRDAASGSFHTRNELPDTEQTKALLHLTSKLCAAELTKIGNTKKPYVFIGREVLRIYFASQLCSAKYLREKYLWLNQQNENTYQNVPGEVRRQYLLNLSRYMLGVVEILQRRSNIVSKPKAVSQIEFLDGLLYAIDRFAHVEIRVDDRLHIRKYLGKGFVSEIKRHMKQEFYRDHLIHVIDVFLLGLLFLKTSIQWNEGEEHSLLTYISKFCCDRTPNEDQKILFPEEHWLKNWTVAALYHDLGYQVDTPNEMRDSSADSFRFFSLPRPTSIKWLDLFDSDSSSKYDKLKKMAKKFSESSEHCSWLPQISDENMKDHGVISALRVAQLLTYMDCEGQSNNGEAKFAMLNEYLKSLHAIAHHNLFSRAVQFETHPLSCLLRLCDELQEWCRRRVNIEKIVKHLYLQIEENQIESIEGHENLKSLSANILFSCSKKDGLVEVSTKLIGNQPDFKFWLDYMDPVQAQYDAVTTFLSKAYNFQHVKLTNPKKNAAMQWNVFLNFPRPKEYLGLSEHDIYGLLRERVRVLPEMWQYNYDQLHYPAGLVWLNDERPDTDRIAIIVDGRTIESRIGWQTCNPDILRKRLLKLKRKILARFTLGPDDHWLIKN